MPEIGSTVIMAGRRGKKICVGRVAGLNKAKINNHTTIISAVYPKEFFDEVVTMNRVK